jgi:hypothetical protein
MKNRDFLIIVALGGLCYSLLSLVGKAYGGGFTLGACVAFLSFGLLKSGLEKGLINPERKIVHSLFMGLRVMLAIVIISSGLRCGLHPLGMMLGLTFALIAWIRMQLERLKSSCSEDFV